MANDILRQALGFDLLPHKYVSGCNIWVKGGKTGHKALMILDICSAQYFLENKMP